VTGSPALVGEQRGGSLHQKRTQKKKEGLLMRPYALRRKLLVRPRLVFPRGHPLGVVHPSTRGRATNQVKQDSVMIRGREGAEERVSVRSEEMSLRSRAKGGNSAINVLLAFRPGRLGFSHDDEHQ
jgi:hypothetical protein